VKHDIGYADVVVPDGWEDRRSVQFLSPPLVVGDARLQATSGGRVTGPRKSFIVNVGDKGAVQLEELAIQQVAVLQEAIPGLQVNGRSTWQHPRYGPCPTIDITVQPDTEGATRQLMIFVPGEKLVATLTYATRPDDKKADDEVRALFDGFSWR
jgi:hypothetical protein